MKNKKKRPRGFFDRILIHNFVDTDEKVFGSLANRQKYADDLAEYREEEEQKGESSERK